eukprot:gene24663-biopygen2930
MPVRAKNKAPPNRKLSPYEGRAVGRSENLGWAWGVSQFFPRSVDFREFAPALFFRNVHCLPRHSQAPARGAGAEGGGVEDDEAKGGRDTGAGHGAGCKPCLAWGVARAWRGHVLFPPGVTGQACATPAPRPRHARATPAPRPRHARATPAP